MRQEPSSPAEDGTLRFAVRSTLVDAAYTELRRAILSGRFLPGSKLVVRPLSEELGLSATPVKAALIALEREGFITSQPHHGFLVAELTEADVREVFEIREVLEGLAGARAASREDHAELAEVLRGMLRQQEQVAAAGDLVGYITLDLEFHQAIWRHSGNERLFNLATNLACQVRFGGGTSARLEGRFPLVLQEHAKIIEAIARGDSKVAAAASQRHVRLAREAFARYFRRLGSDQEGSSNGRHIPPADQD